MNTFPSNEIFALLLRPYGIIDSAWAMPLLETSSSIQADGNVSISHVLALLI